MLSSSTAFFSETYNTCRNRTAHLSEDASILENELQSLWYAAAFSGELTTLEGHRVQIVSPGWWNKQQGPDFRNAQIKFNGQLCTGDVEIHVSANDWYAHGHHRDPEYNRVLLHVLQSPPGTPGKPALTVAGNTIATLVFPPEVLLRHSNKGHAIQERCGQCAASLAQRKAETLGHFLDLAGEWRMLDKARRIRERMQRVSSEQAVYEFFMAACGYSRYKKAFQQIAEALPYERALQLARQDPFTLEAAFLKLGGLWPEKWPYDSPPSNHYQQLSSLLDEQLPGLKSLGLEWPRSGARPANYPERRVAGAARFLTRTAELGLLKQLDLLWRQPINPTARRRSFEALFGGATGYWANNFNWSGVQVQKATAPLGKGRIRTIIGNVLIPAALALIRQETDSLIPEKNVYDLFIALPREPENHIHRRMVSWLDLKASAVKLTFRRQQGLMQIHEDWCAHNPSCQH